MQEPVHEARLAPLSGRLTTGIFNYQTGLLVGAALFFAIVSPYGAVTYLPFVARWAYWLGLLTLIWLIHAGCQFANHRFDWDLSRWWLAVIASVVATPVVLVAILVVQKLIGVPVPQTYWIRLSGSIWLICVVLTVLRTALPLPAAESDQSFTPASNDSVEILRQRLPASLRSDAVLAVAAQDHYVMVYLAGGTHLTHMRFGDAVDLLAGEDGLAVHRSWWVARAAVRDVVKNGRQFTILLTNGQQIPVSRSGAARLKSEGWTT